MEKYSHKERIQMILCGETPDRYAASFWRHFFHMEHNAEGLAEAMLYFQKEYDWDFMKINPRADFHVEDWGLKLEWSRDEFKKHKKSNFPITSPDDWLKIQALDFKVPVFSEILTAVSLIKKKSDPELPLLMTIFTPLAVAGRLVEDDKLLADHIKNHPEKVKAALEAITETYINFVSELRNAGADGLFYATTQWASSNLISWEDYKQFGIPYDLEVIKAAGDDAINLFHVCSSNNFLKELSEIDYKASFYNWDGSDASNLPVDKASEYLKDKVIVGGVDHKGWLQMGNPEEVGYQIDKLKDMTDKRRFIIGPGCSIDPATPADNLRAIRDRL